MAKIESVVEIEYQEFVGQREDEDVIIVLFRHWYTLVAPIVRSILIILGSFVVPIWLNIAEFIFSYGWSTLLYYGWLVFWVGAIVYDYITWYRDRYILTTQRVIDIDQRGMFNRRVAEVELDRIQAITHTIQGLPATILNFGTITIHSAGASDLTIRQVARPAEVQEDIARLVKEIGKPGGRIDEIKFVREENL